MTRQYTEMENEAALKNAIENGTAVPLDYFVQESNGQYSVVIYRGATTNRHPVFIATSGEPTREAALNKAHKRIFSAGEEGCRAAVERFEAIHGGNV